MNVSFIGRNDVMKGNLITLDNGAPKIRAIGEESRKIKIGVITSKYGGIYWVRDELRQDKDIPIKPSRMSDYWHKVSEQLFRRW